MTADTGQIPGMYDKLSSTTGGQADAQENTAAGASANNQSFGDQFGGAFATGLGKGLAGLATGGPLNPANDVPSGGGSAPSGAQSLASVQQLAADGGPEQLESGPAEDELLM